MLLPHIREGHIDSLCIHFICEFGSGRWCIPMISKLIKQIFYVRGDVS